MPYVVDKKYETDLETIRSFIQSAGSCIVSNHFIFETLWRRFSSETQDVVFEEVTPKTLASFEVWLRNKS